MAPAEVIVVDLVLIDGELGMVKLTANGVLEAIEYGEPSRYWTVKKDVLGFVVEGKYIRIKTVVEREEGICCGEFGGDYSRKDFVFEPFSEDAKNRFCFKLRHYLDSLGRPKRLLVFVNPFGGKKSAIKIFEKEVKPLFEDADIQLDVQETKYQLHAKEMVRSMDVSKYDGIVCVSGDGVLVEVRTGNGMIKSLLDAVGLQCCANSATISIIRGHTRSLDVATISQGNTKFFSVLMLAWGLVADIDIESEKFRWMGSARMDFYAIQRIISLRQYNGRVLFLPAPGFESYGQPTSYRLHKEPPVKVLGYQGPDTKFEDVEWREIKGPFVSVWLHNVPWGAENNLVAPAAKFSDGFLDLIVVKNCPKLALLSLMTQISEGTHVQSPYVAYLKVKAFALEPGALVDEPDKEGIIDADGEVLARGRRTYKCEQIALMSYDKLQITVDQGLATLFSPEY
uniref:DAGKc domain-containing protein n=1 Tax=Brassica campestris TaxID=3711 RepID=M4DWK1_BRACM